MVAITFPNRETEKRALSFIVGRFVSRVLKSGEHIVPEAALEALAGQNIPFTVQGKAASDNGDDSSPNQMMLGAMAKVEALQKGMHPKDDKHTQDYLREARSGGMYGDDLGE